MSCFVLFRHDRLPLGFTFSTRCLLDEKRSPLVAAQCLIVPLWQGEQFDLFDFTAFCFLSFCFFFFKSFKGLTLLSWTRFSMRTTFVRENGTRRD